MLTACIGNLAILNEDPITGKLKYEVVEGRTTATCVYAKYPLKFLHPRQAIHQSFDTYITYLLSYGGGLVGGDSVSVECDLGSDTSVVLATQASTKVFKSENEGQFVSQTFKVRVATNATLAFLPDPVTCFKRAKYRQTQVFNLDKNANLVFVDWLTSGRKRSYLATESIRDNRTETLEHWDFSEYDTKSEVFVDGERLVTDRVRLADEEDVSLRQRMHNMHVLGLMVIVGPKLKVIVGQLLELSTRKKLHNARDITPQGRLATANTFPGVIASASSLGPNSVMVRFCGQDMEVAMNYVKTTLEPLKGIVGYSPYQENR
ncbi:urease accessory protein d isoform 1 [Plasmopara halstedii]|uniref:Urease accessory protein d isoform 1 n=1 Tax=Plasmopara halstedii TaxID=4781 RepID=A0A0P1AD14_PLAHL|nr:urease accessory protein d isoform 1 [Plasmopara halstedii]CEG38327.1 urease accessory protein d isoform 1 [Plasmopara halstedii]|eukprot:XP_024574696.1 urease accessory protein d isoform 1 [Plasmopara halstedii]